MSVKFLKISLFLLAIGATTIASIIAFSHRPSLNPVVEAQVNEKAPKPLFVLIEYNPWAMVIGADMPTLALYDDGTVIYWRKEGRGGKYVSAKLTDSEVSQVLEKVNPQTFASLDSRYEPAGGISDAPATVMILQQKDGTYKGVYVYGSIRRADDGSYPGGVPNLVADIFHFATNYNNPKAVEWLPDYIELIVWPYEYAPDKDLIWPKGWPDLSDSRTVKNDDGYSIYLEKARFEELKAFLAKRRERQAVRISGKKWAIDARLPFPDERIWREVKSRLGSDSH